MFKAAGLIIDAIGKDCEKTGEALKSALEGLLVVSCTADAKGKADAYAVAEEAIRAGREDCPGHEKDFDALDELLEMSKSVKCGGG